MNPRDFLFSIPGITPEEMMFLQHYTTHFDENEIRKFVMLYSGRRKKSQEIMLFTLLGFFGVAGVQRVLLGQVAMGVIYFLTIGFCWIGTIIDLINHQSMTDEYNQKVARDCARMVAMKAY